jgi:hypothetical protein
MEYWCGNPECLKDEDGMVSSPWISVLLLPPGLFFPVMGPSQTMVLDLLICVGEKLRFSFLKAETTGRVLTMPEYSHGLGRK